MNLDWEGDPELRKMRAEFIASFAERRVALTAALASGGPPAGGTVREWLAEPRMAAHKLAGAAESYGFPTVTAAAAALDELLSASPAPESAAFLAESIRLLDAMLASIQAECRDPAELRADPRFGRLISAAGSPDAGSTS
jgi:HPt (histidine-containing phosphotransfer) domain-containing protein